MRVGLVAATALGLLSGLAAAQPDDTSAPVLLEANEVIYDRTGNRAIARGEVSLAQGGYTVLADEVVYDRTAGTVEAVGNVVLIDDLGDSYFAERMELGDDLEQGFIETVSVRLADESLLVARRGDRRPDGTTVFRDIAYTPCVVCDDAAPTWQIRADKVTHDQTERTITYQNAWLEFGGVPVLYTPYFEHFDATVDRKSGFLTPSFKIDSELGAIIETPYYWAQAPNRDFTFRPSITTDEGPILAIDMRDLQTVGRTNLTVSGTYASFRKDDGQTEDRFRGHLRGDGRYGLGNDWIGGFDLSVVTDDTYLRRYGIDDANVLNNRAFVQRYQNDRFVDAALLGFQDLAPNSDQGQVPIALPHLRAEYTGTFDQWGARWRLRPDLLVLERSEGIDSRRASVAADLEAVRVSPFGDVLTATATLRGDFYAVQGNVATGLNDGEDSFTARLMPRASLDWRRPYSRAAASADGITYGLEPQVNVVLSPTGYDDADIPDDDSLSLEFDETNLFRANRFTGRDVWDEGMRVDYGLRTSATTPDRELWSVFLGQSYRFSETDVFDGVSGLDEDLSDVVGRVGLSPHPYVDVDYRFRFSARDAELSKSDLQLVAGPPRVRVGFGHLLLNEEIEGFGRREEARGAISLRLSENWSAIASTRIDLDAGDRILDTYGVMYEDECLFVILGVEQDFTRDGDAEPSTTVALRVSLRNLGEFGGQTSLSTTAN